MEFSKVPHLLILAPNWLGDAVMALPAIADVARGMPDTRIAVAARRSVAPLFTMAPGVQSVVPLEARAGAGDAVRTIRAGAYGAAILMPNAFAAALLAWRGGVRERWGYRSDCRGPLLTRAIPPPIERVHQAAYYQHLVRALGYANGPLEARLEAGEGARAAGTALLVAAGWDERRPLVALAPGAAYGGAKRWPASSFAELAAALAADGVVSVLIGGPGDTAAGEQVTAAAGGGIGLLNLIGRTDLPALAGVLLRCRTLVSNDSGAMHFGAALGVGVTALFGPTDERATRPLGRGDAPEPVVLTSDVWCRPCLLRECPLTHRCLRGIDVGRVSAQVARSL